QRALEPRLELAAIHETREDVVARVIGKLAIELPALAHVVEHEHAAGYVAGAVADRRGAAFAIELIAVAPNEERRATGLDRARPAKRDGERVPERRARLRVEAAEDLADDPALSVLQAPARELLGDRSQGLGAALRVCRARAVAARLQRDLRALLLL